MTRFARVLACVMILAGLQGANIASAGTATTSPSASSWLASRPPAPPPIPDGMPGDRLGTFANPTNDQVWQYTATQLIDSVGGLEMMRIAAEVNGISPQAKAKATAPGKILLSGSLSNVVVIAPSAAEADRAAAQVKQHSEVGRVSTQVGDEPTIPTFWSGNTQWIAGSLLTSRYNGYTCSKGLDYYDTYNFYNSTAEHCFTGNPHFAYYGYNYIPLGGSTNPPNPPYNDLAYGFWYYDSIDTALSKVNCIDPSCGSYPQSANLWDYCDGVGCGSPWGCQGTSPCQASWNGAYRQIMGSANIGQGSRVCKSGALGGTSCGYVFATYFNGSVAMFDVNGLNYCGLTGGDSGGPAWLPDPYGNALAVGIVVGSPSGYQQTAPPGNGCYPANQVWYTAFRFYLKSSIEALANVSMYHF